MFSRTTMASSIRRPIASESAISVMTLSVIPRKYMTMNEEMTEIGSVSPVMTVERQELRKQKTIRTVRMPPRISVFCTSSTDSRIMTEPSRTSVDLGPGRELRRGACSISFFTASTTPTVFALRLLEDVEGDGRDAVDERERALLLDAVPRPRRPRRA